MLQNVFSFTVHFCCVKQTVVVGSWGKEDNSGGIISLNLIIALSERPLMSPPLICTS